MADINGYDAWKLASGPEDERIDVATCAYCGDDILEGSEVWQRKETEDCGEVTICSLGCFVFFTAKYDVDIDEFERKVSAR